MKTDSNPIALPSRKLLPHTPPSWVESGSVYFVTVCCTKRDQNQLCFPNVATVVFETVEFRQCRGDWFIHLLLLMPDHVHMLVSYPRDKSLKALVSNWKEVVAKRIGVRWQRDFFDHRLRNDESFDEKAAYIRMNPVRKGLVGTPEQWTFVWQPKL